MGAPQFSINCGGSAGAALPAVLLADGTAAPAAGPTGVATGTVELLTGTPIASASTLNLNTATGNRVHVTGTTTINSVTLTRGPRTVIFDAALVLTHDATNNKLPGAANITTAAGDIAYYESDGTTVYCAAYEKADGTAVVVAGVGNHAVVMTTGNGHGSTNTMRRRFATTLLSVGTAITSADSAANGWAATIAAGHDGLYEMSYLDDSSAVAAIGISLNNAQGTTSIATITAADRIAYANVGGAYPISVTVTYRLAAGDTICAHTDGTPNATTAVATKFSIRKIAQ